MGWGQRVADECEEITGSGCALVVSPPDDPCGNGGGADHDTAEDSGGAIAGNGWFDPRAECAARPGLASGWLLLLALLVLARRAAPCLLLLLLPAVARADGVNADGLVSADGGEALSLFEADVGGTWSPAAAATGNVAWAPVVSRAAGSERVLLDGVASLSVGGSLRVANGPRVGFSFRQMSWSYLGRAESGPGDSLVWVAAPLLDSPRTGLGLTAIGAATFASGPTAVFLSDESGAVDAGMSAGWFSGLVTIHAQTLLRLQQLQTIQNLRWGPQLRWAVAGSARPFRLGLTSVEAFGSLPLELGADVLAQTPVEFLASAGGCLRWGACLRGGGGAGLTWGLGAPELRIVAVLEYRPPPVRDSDDDGIVDLRDRCPREPEDTDLVQDGDGCPETDADQDGVADPLDLCPLVTETANGYNDTDGCPDSVTRVDLLVRGVPDLPAETAIVDGLSPEPGTVFLGEVVSFRSPTGDHAFTVEAEGYRRHDGRVTAFGPTAEVTVQLEPVRYTTVRLRAVSTSGAALGGWVHRGSATKAAQEELPVEGMEWRVEVSPTAWSVHAPGHAAREVQVTPQEGETLDLLVELAPSDVRVEGDRLRFERTLRFELDRAELLREALPVIDDIAGLLAMRPDIELLRVEGHADESGSSRHNLELSRARAEAVRAALVARGIAPERLEAIGSGEAREARTERAADFTILVWADR